MTPEQVALVQQSFAQVVPIADQAAEMFYDRLFEVAPDGRCLLTLSPASLEGDRFLLRRWDIPHPKPWAWIIGVPVTLGAALLGLRAWWASRCSKQSEVPARTA